MSEQIVSNSKSKEMKIHVLLQFTAEVLRNTYSYKNAHIKRDIKVFVGEKKKSEKIHENKFMQPPKKTMTEERWVASIHKKPLESKQREGMPFQNFFNQRTLQTRASGSALQISDSQLPATVRDIRPIPVTTPREINLKKLAPLVKDPFVRIIECNGPEEKVFVLGSMGRKITGIVLTKEDIEEVIKTFADSARIPVAEGLNKIVFGKLVLSAIVSEVIGSKFIIKKMGSPGFPGGSQ